MTEDLDFLFNADDKTPMPFGKHAGVPIGSVPASYLLWAYDNVDHLAGKYPAIFGYIEKNQRLLTLEAKQEESELAECDEVCPPWED